NRSVKFVINEKYIKDLMMEMSENIIKEVTLKMHEEKKSEEETVECKVKSEEKVKNEEEKKNEPKRSSTTEESYSGILIKLSSLDIKLNEIGDIDNLVLELSKK